MYRPIRYFGGFDCVDPFAIERQLNAFLTQNAGQDGFARVGEVIDAGGALQGNGGQARTLTVEYLGGQGICQHHTHEALALPLTDMHAKQHGVRRRGSTNLLANAPGNHTLALETAE